MRLFLIFIFSVVCIHTCFGQTNKAFKVSAKKTNGDLIYSKEMGSITRNLIKILGIL